MTSESGMTRAERAELVCTRVRLLAQGGASVTEIGAALHLTRQRISQIIDQLGIRAQWLETRTRAREAVHALVQRAEFRRCARPALRAALADAQQAGLDVALTSPYRAAVEGLTVQVHVLRSRWFAPQHGPNHPGYYRVRVSTAPAAVHLVFMPGNGRRFLLPSRTAGRSVIVLRAAPVIHEPWPSAEILRAEAGRERRAA